MRVCNEVAAVVFKLSASVYYFWEVFAYPKLAETFNCSRLYDMTLRYIYRSANYRFTYYGYLGVLTVGTFSALFTSDLVNDESMSLILRLEFPLAV